MAPNTTICGGTAWTAEYTRRPLPSEAPSSPNSRSDERPSASQAAGLALGVGVQQLADLEAADVALAVDVELAAGVLAVQQRDERGGPLVHQRIEVVQHGVARASPRISWMKMCTIPPHISPTVPASSSEMP